MKLNKYFLSLFFGKLYLALMGIAFGKNVQAYGLPLVRRHKKASIELKDNVVLTSLSKVNLAGVNHPVILAAVRENSKISIGNHSGISGGVIYAVDSVTIGNYVNIGINVSIFDSDLHSIDWRQRREDKQPFGVSKPVVIEDDVWIGAQVTILKGVRIGRGAVIGAGSVVTKDIPPFTLWAGNPAREIRKLNK